MKTNVNFVVAKGAMKKLVVHCVQCKEKLVLSAHSHWVEWYVPNTSDSSVTDVDVCSEGVHRSKRVKWWWFLPAAWYGNAAHCITQICCHLFTKVRCTEMSRKLYNFPYVKAVEKLAFVLAFCLFVLCVCGGGCFCFVIYVLWIQVKSLYS